MNQIETADLAAAVALITKDMTTAKRVGTIEEKLDKIGSQYTGKELDAFVAGARFATRRFNTALKNAGTGKDKARAAAPKPAPKKAAAPKKQASKAAPAASKTKPAKGVKKAPRGQTKADKGQPVTPSQKVAAAKKALAAKKVATVTNIDQARAAKKVPAKKIVRQVVKP